MGKAAKKRILADNEVKAVHNRIRISTIKLNLVCKAIRGMKASDAVVQLQFMSKRIARDVKKCVESAIANAENNHNLDIDSLIIKEAYVGKSLVMKRFRARARGRGARIFKPFSNLTIVLKEIEEGK